MKKEKDVFKQFRDSFSKMDGHFHILEQRIPVEIQMEYFKYSEQIRSHSDHTEPLSDEECEAISDLLQIETLSNDEKKHLITTLAISKSVKAYRLLKEYVEHPDPAIADWAYMAVMEARISLESEFSDEKQIYISTGLGGKDEKLRFYILILSNDKKVFLEYQKQVIEREFNYLLPQDNCEIERLTIEDNYIELILLIPVRADIKGILGNVITECNQYGDFLSNQYTITNVKELSKEEIKDIITRDGDS
ncbi:hypothetical protein D0T51_00385 [Parabacteroides sp. 52]|uniref:hypothetical protein n=1 Tax=unclassified Parabacteroides TaxID=2649774 RepID=UPI0013D04769|nr:MULTISPECIES: hypothetical protein [unclassified Parabacteroides]MDH6533437.1 hypothetical protein [Parabacteroides sp. PM5-20]NDV54194.1 hypothetical protein [Parabacteroides sp. 52]